MQFLRVKVYTDGFLATHVHTLRVYCNISTLGLKRPVEIQNHVWFTQERYL